MARGRAHLSNTSKVTFLKDIGANKSIGDMPTKEYSASAWLQFKTQWDDVNNRPSEMTPEQEKICSDLANTLHQAGVQLSLTIQEKSGPDYKSWPYVGRCVLFTNSVLSSTHTPIASVSNSPGDSKQSLDQILSGNNPISESEDEIPF
jgi:hypothetical protein|tara:strand:- start:2737 stop:3180 length:444 start_codon:yes stop_codon:yes gene_type:complete